MQLAWPFRGRLHAANVPRKVASIGHERGFVSRNKRKYISLKRVLISLPN